MTVALLLISDGRDCHEESMVSLRAAVDTAAFDQVIHVDDSAHRLGFAGAIQHGWEQVRADWVMHVECDFTFQRPVPVQRMIGVLGRHDHLAQLVLKRQPCNASEQAAGGIVEQHPGDYVECADSGDTWTEHRRFWSTNPCVYSSKWCRLGWPQCPHSEGHFTTRLREDPALRFAFWGAKHDPPLVHHIGVRNGNGY